jgi:NAD(P)-dependent dehydrogenase (short-subunit alcohol dehydrogenase family)
MARILVTGSTTGIGLETAQTLQGLGHDVVWHARSKERAADLDSDAEVVVGDLASLQQTRALADAAGHCDVVIHNAGINWETSGARPATASSASSRSTCSHPTC